jgi:hypothetical protein
MGPDSWQSAAPNSVTRYDRNAVNLIATMGGRYLDLAEGGSAYVEGAVSMTRSTISDNTSL